MRLAAVFLAVLATGCLHDDLVACDDGRDCPAGFTCALNGCLSPDQMTACRATDAMPAKGDGESCEANGHVGVCSQGVCLFSVCGNDIVEAAEMCDDGNTISGDGCNGTCSSDETCGNGIVELDEECDCGDGRPEHPAPSRCAGSINGDAYCSSTCRRRGCGDGVLDPGEACDDGNRDPGDGCNFDCTSTEVCGNGILDYFAGEECDDANVRSLDGCSSTCRAEPYAWQPAGTATMPTLTGASMAYDAARGRLVVFGGTDLFSSVFADTYELDGRAWLKRTVPTSPAAREGASIAYDTRRGRIVMFGGRTNTGTTLFDDTWEYDGVTWTQRVLPTHPPARTDAAMGYDSARGRVVLFGGWTPGGASGQFAGDTWEYDGTAWIERTPAVSPSAHGFAAMAYDARRARMVMFGDGSTVNSETWEYDGTTWTEAQPATLPPQRGSPALAYDARRGVIVMFGGAPLTGGPLADTWEYDGLDWTQRAPATSPAPRSAAAAAYDLAHGRVVVFGGYGSPVYSDTWQWDGTTWTQIAPPPPPSPSPRYSAGMAYDKLRGRAVLFGGSTSSQIDGDTWEHDGTSWTQRAVSGPSPRQYMGMAYDEGRKRIVLFGGIAIGGGGIVNDTWEYDGTSWTQRTPLASPPPRYATAMTYDPSRGEVVLFGGIDDISGNGGLDDAWAYDGTTWTQLPSGPPGRGHAGLAYDSARSKLVLFGGYRNGAQGDTWELDASGWTQRTPAQSPAPRSVSVMAYDPARARVVLFGAGSLQDTWEWDGTTWTQDTFLFDPPARSAAAATYDPIHGRILMFGGASGGTIYNDTWVLGYEQLAPIEACSSGIDYDTDTSVGCSDDDCAAVCSACGNGTCDGIEDCRSCPQDCAVGAAACPAICGDTFCDAPTESAATCPGDCP